MKSVLVLWLTLFLASGALTAAADQGPAGDTHHLDDVTVSASKRETRAHEFPGSVTTFPEPYLDQVGAWVLSDLTRYAPNVYFKKATSGDAIVIRGVSTIDTSLFSPAGLYIDDVAYPLGYMSDPALFDVERVEMLRGPQGTLYGRNSESGIVNLVLKQPDNRFRAKVLSGLANYNTYRLGANLSGPIVADQLYLGGYFLWSHSDGFMNNVTRDDDEAAKEDRLQGRGVLSWTPSPRLDIRLALDASHNDDGIGRLRYTTGPNASQPFVVRSNTADSSSSNNFSQSLRAEYKGDQVVLLSVTNHRYYDHGFLSDMDRSRVPLGTSDVALTMQGWSQEFRFTSRGKRRFTWLMGLYGDYQDLDTSMDRSHVQAAVRAKRSNRTTTSSLATFGQATYALLPGLRFTAGLRLDLSQASGEQDFTSLQGARTFDRDQDQLAALPMASLAYDLNQEITAYASFSTGFLAGGYNYYSPTSNDTFAYDPEYTFNYEVGLKAAWLQGRLQTTLALFHTQVQDKQVREDSGVGVGMWKFSNAAEASTWGGELEVRLRPLPGLDISAGLGYALSEIDQWEVTVNGVAADYAGKRLPWAPEFTFNLGACYQHSSGVFARADLYGAGRQYFDADNSLSQDPYQLVGLRLGYVGENLEVALWCRNLFDQEYATKQVRDGGGNIMQEDGGPRTFGVTLTGRF